MKKLSFFAVFVMVVGVLVLAFAIPAEAGQPEPFLLVADMDFTGENSAAGDFTLSGLVSDSGTVTEEFIHAGPTGHGIKTIVGSKGTIILRFDVQISPSADEGILLATGRWVILSGNGEYADLHGQGSVDTTIYVNEGWLHAEYSGQAHID